MYAKLQESLGIRLAIRGNPLKSAHLINHSLGDYQDLFVAPTRTEGG